MSSLRITMVLGIYFCFFFNPDIIFAQGENAILGNWLTTDKDAKIEIFREGNEFFGKVVWLQEPLEDGKPKVDKKSNEPIMGMLLLNNFQYNDGVWEDGTIYDPKNGKTYSCTIKKKDSDTLEVRGYVGISLIGRTVEWTRVE
jgi:uncharacterized protein (DUF2147 family)